MAWRSPDGNLLYFADFQRGLFGLDLRNSTAFDVAAPANLNLYGIEGLYQYDGQLVAIQSGIQPQRLMRLKLDDSGRAIVLAVPLEQRNRNSPRPRWVPWSAAACTSSPIPSVPTTTATAAPQLARAAAGAGLCHRRALQLDWEPPRMPGS